jgi:transcriptional regulator with XRE-family HTH domain
VSAASVLRESRARHGLTQEQLAIRAGTSQAAISRIERGVVSPSMATLERLVSLTGDELSASALPADYGFDLTFIRDNLALTPEERIRNQARFANKMREIQRQIGVEPVDI